MSGVHRFLSKREKSSKGLFDKSNGTKSTSESSPNTPDTSSSTDFYGLFDSKTKPSGSAEEQKVKIIKQRVLAKKENLVRDNTILWALRSPLSNGDVDAAYNFLLALLDASQGIVSQYNPEIHMLGAQNRGSVTCYLDATMFSIFSRLESFEAMLYRSFDDRPKDKLAFLLRLWVNMLRTGQLVTVDITKQIQEALADCGWKEAAEIRQQDASEAFTFITERLELPLLTLKMDIYHTGKEDETDDHKFIKERLLEVAIPEDTTGQKKEVTLEDCLEEYFNNRIEVKRYLERRTTMNSQRSISMKEKGGAIHIETAEVNSDSSPSTPIASSPSKSIPARPSPRHRTSSIIQERLVPQRADGSFNPLPTIDSDPSRPAPRVRAGSIRKEVMMPAWQFFSLIPWYTDNAPTSDAQVAAHFSQKRPVLGLCLKRYSMTNKGKPVRLGTQIDIPVEIGLPYFIQDDHMDNDGPIYGNFKLSLQALVCHRGNSVNSGHYISIVRSTSETGEKWMRFDDLAAPRVSMTDVQKALKEETPYLLFYQIMPIDGDPGHITVGEQPPPPYVTEETGTVSQDLISDKTSSPPPERISMTPARQSLDVPRVSTSRSISPDDRRRASVISVPEPTTIAASTKEFASEETRTTSPPHPNHGSLSRQYSRSSEGGFAKAFSRMTGLGSKEVLPIDNGTSEVQIREAVSVSTVDERPHRSNFAVLNPKGKRDKSKSRFKTKVRDEKPDRECIVM